MDEELHQHPFGSMDEQVVPSFPLPNHCDGQKRAVPARPTCSIHQNESAGKNATERLPAPVPLFSSWTTTAPANKSTTKKQNGNTTTDQSGIRTRPVSSSESPASEYVGNLRWQTPSRSGRWIESWESAHELGTHVSIRSAQAESVGKALREVVSEAIVKYVGAHLSQNTVDRWLCLLCEYLELNTDEQVLIVCLLRRYLKKGGRFISPGDWQRPQRWECVVAISCYLSVLLTEEFPGRIALDLKELLGANFSFGNEQLVFLKTVDWGISISTEEVMEVKTMCERAITGDANAQMKMRDWFDAKEAHATQAAVTIAQATADMQLTGKKRAYACIAPAEEAMGSRHVVCKVDPTGAVGMSPAGTHGQHLHAQHLHAQHIHAKVMAGVAGAAPAFVPAIPYVGAFGGVPGVPVANVRLVAGIAQVPHWAPRW